MMYNFNNFLFTIFRDLLTNYKFMNVYNILN